MGLAMPFLAASMACVGMLMATLVAGFSLLWKQQRGEKQPDPPVEKIREAEDEVKRIAKDIQLARRDDARSRESWFSFGPRATVFNTDPEVVNLVDKDNESTTSSAATSLRSSKSRFPKSPSRALPLWPLNHASNGENPSRYADPGTSRDGVGGFMDLEQFPDSSLFNGASPRMGSSEFESPSPASSSAGSSPR